MHKPWLGLSIHYIGHWIHPVPFEWNRDNTLKMLLVTLIIQAYVILITYCNLGKFWFKPAQAKSRVSQVKVQMRTLYIDDQIIYAQDKLMNNKEMVKRREKKSFQNLAFHVDMSQLSNDIQPAFIKMFKYILR